MEGRAKHERVDKNTIFFPPSQHRKKETKGNVLLEMISFPHLSWYLLLPSPPQSFLIEFSCSIVEKKGSQHLAPHCGSPPQLIIFILFVNNKWQFLTGQFFWPQLGKPKDDGNRQAIRQKHLVKNYFCRWSHIRTPARCLDTLFWQLKQVLIDIVPNTDRVVLTAHLYSKSVRISRFESLKNWPRKCLERNGANRDNLIKILRAQMDGSNNGLLAELQFLMQFSTMTV